MYVISDALVLAFASNADAPRAYARSPQDTSNAAQAPATTATQRYLLPARVTAERFCECHAPRG